MDAKLEASRTRALSIFKGAVDIKGTLYEGEQGFCYRVEPKTAINSIRCATIIEFDGEIVVCRVPVFGVLKMERKG